MRAIVRYRRRLHLCPINDRYTLQYIGFGSYHMPRSQRRTLCGTDLTVIYRSVRQARTRNSTVSPLSVRLHRLTKTIQFVDAKERCESDLRENAMTIREEALRVAQRIVGRVATSRRRVWKRSASNCSVQSEKTKTQSHAQRPRANLIRDRRCVRCQSHNRRGLCPEQTPADS